MRIASRGQVTIPAHIPKKSGLLPHTDIATKLTLIQTARQDWPSEQLASNAGRSCTILFALFRTYTVISGLLAMRAPMRRMSVALGFTGIVLSAAGQQLTVESEYQRLEDYVSTLRSAGRTVFFTQCEIRAGTKVVLVVPVGADDGEVIQISNIDIRGQAAGVPLNWGKVRFRNGTWNINIDFGGVQTVNYLEKVADDLLRSNFIISAPKQLDTLIVSRATAHCPNHDK